MGEAKDLLSERRATLARVAARLNARNSAQAGLPKLILMTDDARAADYAAAARDLPRGSAVIVRARDATVREGLGRAVTTACRPRGVRVLIADDAALAVRLQADGVHAPQASISKIAGWRKAHPHWLITAAAHDEAAVERAASAGADAVLVSPVFATASHAGARSLGTVRFAAMTARARVCVYALGGIDAGNAARLSASRAAGFALIGGWIRS